MTWPWQSASVPSVTLYSSKLAQVGGGEEGNTAETSPLGGGMARFGKSTCGMENTGPDVFGNFVLSQWVTGAGSVMCLCMADAVSKPWVEVTLHLKPFFST